MTDADKIAFLRERGLMVGASPGTEFAKATVKLEMTRGPGVLDYFAMSEIVELVEYFSRLSCMISLGQPVSPADKFAYNILQHNGVFEHSAR